MTTLMIGQKQQDTFKRYDDFIKSTANGRRLAESCGQDMLVGHRLELNLMGALTVATSL